MEMQLKDSTSGKCTAACCSSKVFGAGALEVGNLHDVGQLNLLTDWLQTVSQSTNISSKLPVHHSLEHVAPELQ